VKKWPAFVGIIALGTGIVAALVAYALTPRPAAVVSSLSQQMPKGVALQSSGPGAGLPELVTGRVAPSFELPNIRGGPAISLAALAGHPVVLNFFASWCPDCRAELKDFAEVYSRSHGVVRFVGVDSDDMARKEALSLLAAARDRYPVAVDSSGGVATSLYLVQALPVTIFIAANGRIAGQVFGAQSVRELSSWVKRLEATVPRGSRA
jgi:cytochrome c biogenesis protein CcmG/thiol:disulfide interchange protein DsbE